MIQAQSQAVADERFDPPINMEEAHARRIKLKDACLAMQRTLLSLSDRSPERRRIIDICQLKQAELSRLKEWMREENRRTARSVAGSEGLATDIKARAQRSLNELMDLTNGQSQRIRELEADNEGLESTIQLLRSRLVHYEPDAGVLSAPGVGIDEWREQV